jgi:hypothetical protein
MYCNVLERGATWLMPRVSEKRWKEKCRLQPVLDVLNGKYGFSKMREDAQELACEDYLTPNELSLCPPDPFYQKASSELRTTLTKWVQEWWGSWNSKPAALVDPNQYASDYLESHKKLEVEFCRIAARIRIEAPVFREILAFQEAPTVDRDFASAVRLVRMLLEGWDSSYAGNVTSRKGGFFISHDPLLLADAEAMRLFLVLLRSPLKQLIRRCDLRGCTRWFLDLTGRGKYCSTQHAQCPANDRLEERRHKQTEEKLRHAQEWIRKWRPAHGPWKPWVARKAKLTTNFLTRWVGQRKLTPPKGVHSSVIP